MKPVYAYAFCSAFDRYHDDRFAIDFYDRAESDKNIARNGERAGAKHRALLHAFV